MKQWQNVTSSQQGIALVEVTIVLPFLLLLLAVIIDFGRIFYEASLLQGRLNASARYLAMHVPVGLCGDDSHKVQCGNASKLALTAWDEGGNPGGAFYRLCCQWSRQADG
ncbi:TadE/TadG family type IV pilus assembly protein [Endozoicomonas sp. ALB115]|uniref:TadE/TadG family type IV pilus assembly protein n=1 Tax=Endozoicomonas sp. ALB115 TaxID=3403074 RepID=UPI003BB7AA43